VLGTPEGRIWEEMGAAGIDGPPSPGAEAMLGKTPDEN
jgi:hypothetical protein